MNLNFLFDSGLLGLEYAMLALGVYITFRILNIPDLTVDGSFTFGLSVSAVFSAAGHPFLGLLMALLAGAVAGCVTGLLQTRWGIHPILAGILTMSGLYTINITVMGSPNISLINSNKFFTFLESALTKDGARYLTVGIIVLLCVGLLALFFKTSLGLCIRATGNNEAMVRASSINPNFTKMVALALSNGLVALSGGVLAQCQGYADINSGSGMIVIGLASVIIGEVFFGLRSILLCLISAVVGSVVYRIIIALALQLDLFDANALKLISAVIVAITLAVPAFKTRFSNWKTRREAGRRA